MSEEEKNEARDADETEIRNEEGSDERKNEQRTAGEKPSAEPAVSYQHARFKHRVGNPDISEREYERD